MQRRTYEFNTYTGVTGYIGLITCIGLLDGGYKVVVTDNLSNSHSEVLRRVECIAGKKITFFPAGIRNQNMLKYVLKNESCEALSYFAGLKAVGESVEKLFLLRQ